MESFQKRQRERRKLEKRRDKADRKAQRDNPETDAPRASRDIDMSSGAGESAGGAAPAPPAPKTES